MAQSETELINQTQLEAVLESIANTIIEDNSNLEEISLVGIVTNGYPIAQRLSKLIQKKTQTPIPVGKLDIALYRDDLLSRDKFVTIRESDIPFNINNKTVILVDDVLFHGRTIRAALNGLIDFGRPQTIKLAVLVDRGHRQLPIFANYIGQTITTTLQDHIQVQLLEIHGEDSIKQTQS